MSDSAVSKGVAPKIILGCLGAFIATVLLVGAGFWFLLMRELPVLDAKLTAENEVAVADVTTMAVVTSNSHDRSVVLDSIDIDSIFLDGFQVLSVKPEPKESMQFFGQQTWSFGTRVEPGESLTVYFELKALKAGRFTGDVDVCNPNQDWHSMVVGYCCEGAGDECSG